MSQLQEAVEAAQALLEIEGVVGVGEGRMGDQECVVVFVEGRTPEIEERLPREIKGVPVDIRESGTISAQ